MKNKQRLRYFQCYDYKMIPIELIEQFDGEEWTMENYISYQEMMKNNPNYFLFVLVDANLGDKVIGFLCGVIDECRKGLFIRGLSVLPEYQGNIIPFTRKFMEMIVRKSNGFLKNIYWTTNRAKAYSKYGFHESKYKLMCLYKEN